MFNNPRSGVYEKSKVKRNVYYHVRGNCILLHFADFDSSCVIIPDDVKSQLQFEHKDLLKNDLNLVL